LDLTLSYGKNTAEKIYAMMQKIIDPKFKLHEEKIDTS
jgi:hypothetical protein